MALGPIFLALGGLDPASPSAAWASSREMTLAAVGRAAMMLADLHGRHHGGLRTNLSQIVLASQGPDGPSSTPPTHWPLRRCSSCCLAETGRIPVDNPATPPGADDDSARRCCWNIRAATGAHRVGRVDQQLVLCAAGDIFFPGRIGSGAERAAFGLGLLFFVAKLIVLAGAVVLVEFTNAKLRLFRVPDLLRAAFILATLALVSTFLFR